MSCFIRAIALEFFWPVVPKKESLLPKMGRDLRKFAKQTNTRLILGGILLVLVVGDGLIYLIYGQGAAVLAFVCLLFGMAPLVLILLVFWGIDWLVKRERDKQ